MEKIGEERKNFVHPNPQCISELFDQPREQVLRVFKDVLCESKFIHDARECVQKCRLQVEDVVKKKFSTVCAHTKLSTVDMGKMAEWGFDQDNISNLGKHLEEAARLCSQSDRHVMLATKQLAPLVNTLWDDVVERCKIAAAWIAAAGWGRLEFNNMKIVYLDPPVGVLYVMGRDPACDYKAVDLWTNPDGFSVISYCWSNNYSQFASMLHSDHLHLFRAVALVESTVAYAALRKVLLWRYVLYMCMLMWLSAFECMQQKVSVCCLDSTALNFSNRV